MMDSLLISWPRSRIWKIMSQDTPVSAPVDVECYASYRAEQTPRRFRLGDRPIENHRGGGVGWRLITGTFQVQDGQGDRDTQRVTIIVVKHEPEVPRCTSIH